MKYCTNCGQMLPDFAKFCASCGHPQEVLAIPEEEKAETPVVEEPIVEETPIIEEPVEEEIPAVEEEPVADEPIIEEPVEETLVEEEPIIEVETPQVVEEPVVEETPVVNQQVNNQQQVVEETPEVPEPVEDTPVEEAPSEAAGKFDLEKKINNKFLQFFLFKDQLKYSIIFFVGLIFFTILFWVLAAHSRWVLGIFRFLVPFMLSLITLARVSFIFVLEILKNKFNDMFNILLKGTFAVLHFFLFILNFIFMVI